MLTFLDTLYDQATEQLLLLGTIEKAEGAGKKKSPVEIHVVTVQDSEDSSDGADSIEVKKKKEMRKKVKEEIGACPNCKGKHTF